MVVLELRDTGLKRGKSVLKSGNVSINTCTLQPNSISQILLREGPTNLESLLKMTLV